METQNLIELFRELASKSEEVGRLKATLEMKDRALAGLQAQLGIGIPSVITSQIEHVCNCENNTKENVETITASIESPVEIVESPVEEVVETPKKKAGRPKGSKNTSAKKSITNVEKTIPGGSVFKDFVPLDLDNLVAEHSNAYMPPQKSNILTVL